MNTSDGPHIPRIQVAKRLWNMASRDDSTCPRLTRKTDGGAIDNVGLRDDMVMICHGFNGSKNPDGRSIATLTIKNHLICHAG